MQKNGQSNEFVNYLQTAFEYKYFKVFLIEIYTHWKVLIFLNTKITEYYENTGLLRAKFWSKKSISRDQQPFTWGLTFFCNLDWNLTWIIDGRFAILLFKFQFWNDQSPCQPCFHVVSCC